MPDIASVTSGGGSEMFNADKNVGGVSQSEFLELLIVQLQHQDPMEPADSQQFASQLAEFTSLEELQNLNKTSTQGVETNLMLAQTINNTMAATMIGKEVKAIGDVINLNTPGESTELNFDLGLPADDITVSIKDIAGTVIRTIKMDPMQEGSHTVVWDGKNNNGVDAAPEQYYFSVDAFNAAGEQIAVDTVLYGVIDAVSYGTGGATFMVNGREIPFSAVLELAQPKSEVVVDEESDDELDEEDPEHTENS